MLDTCPKPNSCGTHTPIWTNATMPSFVGETTTIDVFELFKGNCKYVSAKVKVIRCSWNNLHDFIYQYSGSYYDMCFAAFLWNVVRRCPLLLH